MSKSKPSKSEAKILLGISSCLLGESVRYDGEHKYDSYINETLAEYFTFRSFCPEMEIGLGVPRKPIRLMRSNSGGIACTRVDDESEQFTGLLQDCANQQTWHRELRGYILKRGSPSCGKERVKVWQQGESIENGSGVYAQQLMDNYPCLPCEEEAQLEDPERRENFIRRVLIMDRWLKMVESNLTVSDFADFHERHQLSIMSHDALACRHLDGLVSSLTEQNLLVEADKYIRIVMQAMSESAKLENQLLVLKHVQSYLKDSLSGGEKDALSQVIEKIGTSETVFSNSLSLMNELSLKYSNEYLSRSWFMKPDPLESVFTAN